MLPQRPKCKRESEPLIPPSAKRSRAALEHATADPPRFNDFVMFWTQNLCWPREFSRAGDEMIHLLARKKSYALLRRDTSNRASNTAPSSTTTTDQESRQDKSADYQDPHYEAILASKGSFMDKDKQGITDGSKDKCQKLLDGQQRVPDGTLFSNDCFEDTCEAIRTRHETRVIKDINLLIVPSAETFAIQGDQHCMLLIESTDEGWDDSIPLTESRPQPDYSVGFRREAFTNQQLEKLQPFLGGLTDTSFFMATYYMYFPFFACEVKCGAATLDVVDRQNAHSMTMAIRGVVELFRMVKREKELDREILAFSISHDHRSVRIYGHYPVIDGDKTTYYRHPIHSFDVTAQDGKEKWTAYTFTKNVYDVWMPAQFKRLCSAIDAIPTDERSTMYFMDAH